MMRNQWISVSRFRKGISTQHFKAQRGHGGAGKNRTGAGGKDLIIKVPVGTQIISDPDEEGYRRLTCPMAGRPSWSLCSTSSPVGSKSSTS